MIYVWAVVIFVTALAGFALAGLYQSGERERERLARLADPRPLPGEFPIVREDNSLPRAGLFDTPGWVHTGNSDLLIIDYGPFPDTGSLLIMSEHAAALDALERETRRLIVQAEQAIPERWR